MKERNAPDLTKPSIVFLSFFGVGFLPYAPGTWGSLAICPLLFILKLSHAPFFVFIPFLIVSTAITSYITDVVQRKYALHDPGWIVMDEVLGMWCAWLFSMGSENNFGSLVLVFALFRFFDIFKFWPASYFDKKMQHGAGTILDDIVSGLYAGGVYLLIKNFGPDSISQFI